MEPITPNCSFSENVAKARFALENNHVDAKNYDYCSKRSYLTRPNSFLESVIHMLMCGLGSGLVVLHAAYMECGLFASMAINIFLSAIVSYCVCIPSWYPGLFTSDNPNHRFYYKILFWSAQKLYGRVQKLELTYPDVMEAAMLLSPWPQCQKVARTSRYLVEITLLCHLYGSCLVLVIMIARNLQELVTRNDTINDTGNPSLSLKVVILSLMIPCAIICMVTDMKCLAPFALICDLFGGALILVLLWYSLHDIKLSPMDITPYKNVTGLVEFACICTFVLEPICYAFAIENNMQQPRNFHIVVLAAMPIYTVAMMTVGFLGYWCYGENSVVPITVHFPFSPFAVILKMFSCITLYVIYALYFYLAFDIEWYYLRRNHKLSNHWFWERVYRALHVVALTLLAYTLPNVTKMMGILGAFSTTPAVFIYPPLIALLVNWEHPGLGRFKWKPISYISIMLLGFILVVAESYYYIVGMIRETSPKTIVNADIF